MEQAASLLLTYIHLLLEIPTYGDTKVKCIFYCVQKLTFYFLIAHIYDFKITHAKQILKNKGD